MADPRHRAMAILRHYGCRVRLARQAGDHIGRADARTSLADARAALCLAVGVADEDITSLGYHVGRAAYERSRASWQLLYRDDPSDWVLKHAGISRANWLHRRPEWDDDWDLSTETPEADEDPDPEPPAQRRPVETLLSSLLTGGADER